jgi:hypothetical protein
MVMLPARAESGIPPGFCAILERNWKMANSTDEVTSLKGDYRYRLGEGGSPFIRKLLFPRKMAGQWASRAIGR